MPKSIIEQRVDAAWDAVTAAVSSGLAANGEKTLADVVPIVAKKPASATWRRAKTLRVCPGRLRLRESKRPTTVIDYEFRFTLDYDTLAAPEDSQITAWAAAARSFELLDVLGRLAVAGLSLERRVEDVGNAAPSGGWGQIRCVTFKLDAAVGESLGPVKLLGWDGPIPLAERLPRRTWADCLLLPKGGGPHLRRLAGLTLGWLPARDDAIDLVLAEQLEIVNAGRQTVSTIRLRLG
jgi:hypothetical protein